MQKARVQNIFLSNSDDGHGRLRLFAILDAASSMNKSVHVIEIKKC
jgi:hypothetical protein